MNAEHRADFEAFVAARSPALFRTAMALTGHREEAEDLLQTVLAKAYRHWRRIRDGHPEAYVRTAMYHQQVSWWRRVDHGVGAGRGRHGRRLLHDQHLGVRGFTTRASPA